MPLSDSVSNFLREFMQTAFLTPQQQSQRKMQMQQQDQQQSQFESQQQMEQARMAQQQEEAKAKLWAEYMRIGYGPPQPGQQQSPPPQQPQQGGPGLNGPNGGPMTGAGSPPPRPDPSLVSLAPYLGMFGMGPQGGQSQTPNAPNQTHAPSSAPPNLMQGNGGMSANGGVVSPAASTASQIMPTAFSVPGIGGPMQVQRMDKPEPEGFDFQIPKELQTMLGTNPIHVKDIKDVAQIVDTVYKSQNKPETKVDEDDKYRIIAGKGLGVNFDPAKPIIDQLTNLDPKVARNIMLEATKLKEGPDYDLNRAAKQATLALRKDEDIKTRLLQEQWDNANGPEAVNGMVSRMTQHPDIYNSDSFSPQFKNVVAQAWTKKTGLPEPKKVDADKIGETAAYSIQDAMAEMQQLGKKLGPAKLGAVVGRLENAQGDWGDSIYDSGEDAKTESRFRYLAASIAAQETKIQSGGRANVQIYNALKSVSPRLSQDVNMLAGAFQGITDRINGTLDSGVKARFGPTVRRAPDGIIFRKLPTGQWQSIPGVSVN